VNNAAALKKAYRLLSAVLREGAYIHIALRNARLMPDERAFVTRLVKGVVERSAELDAAVAALTEKPPKQDLRLILKIGIYLQRYMDIPDYAATDETVALAKALGKGGASGFVNAVLNRALTLPRAVEVSPALPAWLCKKLCARFGEPECAALCAAFSAENNRGIHVRLAPVFARSETARALISSEVGAFTPSIQGFSYYYVTHSTAKHMTDSLPKGSFFVQNLGSCLVCIAAQNAAAAAGVPAKNILDVCAAPGGKAVYLAQLFPAARVVARDVHAHRVRLTRYYVADAGMSNIEVEQGDATVPRREDEGQFDLVLADVPCSGFGVLARRADVALRRKEEDVAALAALQRDILAASAHAVAPGGVLVYATCTLLAEENDDVCNAFLAAHSASFEALPVALPVPFFPVGAYAQLLPTVSGCDAFFIAAFRRLA
jgi:16S rRNA (cytosine967-C5)-methyltransferase